MTRPLSYYLLCYGSTFDYPLAHSFLMCRKSACLSLRPGKGLGIQKVYPAGCVDGRGQRSFAKRSVDDFV